MADDNTADPDGPVDLGSFTVDGPTQLNDTLDVTKPATFSDITSSGLVNAELLAVNTQFVNQQQVSETSDVQGDSYVGGDMHVQGGAYFGAGNPGDADPTALAYASVVDGNIIGTTITANGVLTGASIVSYGDLTAATANITQGSIGNLQGSSLAYGTGTFNSLSVSGTTIGSGGTINATSVKTGTLEATGNSTLANVTATSLTTTGALAGATLAVSGAASLGNTTINGTLAVTGTSTYTSRITANGGIVTSDVLSATLNTTGAASVGTNFGVGGNATVVGSVTTANILAAAGYLTGGPGKAHYWDTAYVANANKLMNEPVIWNVSGNNGLLGTGIFGQSYAAVLDWLYVPPMAGSLQSITGSVYTNAAATVTYALFINGTNAFSGTVTTAAATRKTFALTSARGVLTFAAGASLQLYIKASVGLTSFYSIVTPHVYL